VHTGSGFVGNEFSKFCIVDPDGVHCGLVAHERMEKINLLLVIGKVVGLPGHCSMFLTPLRECWMEWNRLVLSVGQHFNVVDVAGGFLVIHGKLYRGCGRSIGCMIG